MSDFSNILGGLNIPSQIPLDVKSYSANELILSDLGDNFNLAYTYYKGLRVFCFEEQTTWEWKEVLSGQENTGLIEDDFVYPANIITFGVDYSNKTYNFFKVETPLVSTFVEEGDNITITGDGTEINPYVFTGLSSPFNSTNNSYFPRNRDESQFGNIGEFAYDFSYAAIGANDDPYGQIGQIGIHPTEQYGALGELSYVFGYNSSSEAFGSFIAGHYNHSGTLSDLSSLFGRNNYSNSPHSLIAGAYNQAPFTALGYKTIFGQGNLVNGVASLTSGIALLNKSFGTTVLGQANLDYTNTSESVNNSTAPILIVGNGNITTPLDGLWTATSRSNALVLLKNGLLTLPSVTNALITADVTGKAAISKEYLESVLPSISNGSETKLEAGANINIIGLGTTDVPYVISSTNDDITQYTDEFAQQAVGSILENNNDITFTYDNLTPSISANLSEDYTTSINFRFEEIESLLNRDSYITNVGTYEKTSTTNLQINPNWNWKIDRILYANVITQNITIPLCENGFNRIDLVVLNQLNTAELILGEETEGTAVSPTVPPNKLQAFLINVGDTDFEEEIPLLTNQVSQNVRTGVTETAPSEQAVIDYVSEQTTILDNSKADRSFITGASKAKITYNNEGIVVAGADLIESDIPTLSQAKITGLTTDLALKANLASPTFTGSVVVPNGTVSNEAVNKGQLDGVSAKVSQYKTYFINTATGNNATGVFEDASKPFATIDYVLGLGTYEGGTIFLQNAGTFALNTAIPSAYPIKFQSDVASEIVLSANINTFLFTTASGNDIEFDMPLGKLTNNRSGGSGVNMYGNTSRKYIFRLNEIYSNQSNVFISAPAFLDFRVKKCTSASTLLATIPNYTNDINIDEFVCLSTNTRLLSDSSTQITTFNISLISGSGSFRFDGGRYNIGNITTTGICTTSSSSNFVNFVNSNITSTGGINLGSSGNSSFPLIITGNIASATSIFGLIVKLSTGNGFPIKFLNFSANMGTGTFSMNMKGNLIFENCSIKSTNSPFTLVTGSDNNAELEIKNSTFEVVNAVPLITGGAGGTNTVKIAGVSTNATMISDQSGTGVTVTQFTNY